jgi:hypothetical protein
MNKTFLNSRFAVWFYRSSVMLFFCFMISGCEPLYYDIPEENRPVFKSGDVFTYHADTGESDTLEVELTKYDYVSDKRYHYESLYVYFRKVNNGQTGAEFLVVEHGTLRRSILYMPDAEINLLEAGTLTLKNGIVLDYVYHYEVNGLPDSEPKELWYHHRFGLLQYAYADGLIMKLD